uniref:hypothetical protein n=1 Tax=Raoultella sp. 18083 TaxID=2681462 RepID=UPI00190FA681
RLQLPELGARYSLRSLNEGNTAQAEATDGRVRVRPGTYLLTAAGKSSTAWTAQSPLGGIRLGEYAAQAATALGPQVRHQALSQASAGKPVVISALVTGAGPADSVFLVAQHYYGRTRTLPMRSSSYAAYQATVPAELTYAGLLRY